MSISDEARVSGARRQIETASVVDAVLNRLRFDIMTGRIPPGEPLMISAISQELGVSPIPVREALRQLEGEGFIERHHGRGVRVTPVTVERLRDIFRIRLAMEPDLAARAATLLTDADIQKLTGLLERLRFDEYPGDVEEVLRVHYGFHRALVLPAASEWDLRVLTLLWNAGDRFMGIVFSNWPNVWRESYLPEIHLPLYEAAVQRDPEAMREALTRHLIDGVDMLAEVLASQQGGARRD